MMRKLTGAIKGGRSRISRYYRPGKVRQGNASAPAKVREREANKRREERAAAVSRVQHYCLEQVTTAD